MDEEDNLTRQVDEIEASASIYGDDWCTINAASREYSIQVTDGEDKPTRKIQILISLPVDYPSNSPPQYQLNAPWLRGEERRKLANKLNDIYCDNLGENIIYTWVECVREFVIFKSCEADPPEGAGCVAEAADDLDLEGLAMAKAQNPSKNREPAVEEGLVVQCPEIFHGEFVHDRKSSFQPHCAGISHEAQVELVMDKLCENRKVADATHNIWAYRVTRMKNGIPVHVHDCRDDGEIHAGGRLLHLLEMMGAENVIVIVTRWYGGIHLGPDRFKHINCCARQVLLANGYIRDKEDSKKGPKSRKKGK